MAPDLSERNIRLLEGSGGWIQMAGSSASDPGFIGPSLGRTVTVGSAAGAERRPASVGTGSSMAAITIRPRMPIQRRWWTPEGVVRNCSSFLVCLFMILNLSFWIGVKHPPRPLPAPRSKAGDRERVHSFRAAPIVGNTALRLHGTLVPMRGGTVVTEGHNHRIERVRGAKVTAGGALLGARLCVGMVRASRPADGREDRRTDGHEGRRTDGHEGRRTDGHEGRRYLVKGPVEQDSCSDNNPLLIR